MPERWLNLKVAPECEVALPLEAVERVVHRADPDYGELSPQAWSLAAALGVTPDQKLPGVLVLLKGGACWHAGEALFRAEGEKARFMAVAPCLLDSKHPWCTGVFEFENRWAFVANPGALEALHG